MTFSPGHSHGARRLAFASIVLLYLGFGIAYVYRVPLWQAPDEPAHVNYLLHIARGNGIPVLEAGAYDRTYLERLTGGRFREGLPVDGVAYEAHQPPLYYLLLAPIARLYDASGPEPTVRALRLSSLALGLLLLALTWSIGRLLFPNDPVLPLGAMAFVALLPQHLAMLAAVNNDVLAEIMVAGILLTSLLIYRPTSRLKPSLRTWGRLSVVTGAVVGAALLTKTTAYAAAALPLVAAFLSLRSSTGSGPPPGSGNDLADPTPAGGTTAALGCPRVGEGAYPPSQVVPPTSLRGSAAAPGRSKLGWGRPAGPLTCLLPIYGIGITIGAMWWLRNASIYGGSDILGLVRHAEVVAGQPQVAEWTPSQLRTAFVTTFQSFWLQLGWMGAPAEAWLYQALSAISGCIAAGVAAAIKRHWDRGLALCLTLLLLVMLQTAVYNLQFYQPQGRYLFPALVPIAVLVVLGLRELAGPRLYPAALGPMVIGLAGLNVYAHLVVVPTL